VEPVQAHKKLIKLFTDKKMKSGDTAAKFWITYREFLKYNVQTFRGNFKKLKQFHGLICKLILDNEILCRFFESVD